MNWKRTILMWIVIFGIFLVITNLFNKSKNSDELSAGEISLQTTKDSFVEDEEVLIKIKNNRNEPVTLPLGCPKNPFKVFYLAGSEWELREAEAKISCEGLKEIVIPPGETQNLTYAFWNYALFSKTGTYRIEIPLKIGEEEKTFSSNQFTVEQVGIFRSLWRTLLYRPLLNLLLFLATALPIDDLGLSIILLTLVVRIILLIPSQRAIESQKRLQGVQPKLEQIKKKYAGNQERIAQETMALWKEEKVNPFGSCLPLIPQTLVLIALYYVIRNGLNPDNAHLLYGSLKNIDFSTINTNFLGILELTKINAIVLPLAIGLLTYFQMKMSMARKPTAAAEKGPGSEMQMANKMMIYVLPVMIALFTASVPAGVGLYWGISTFFGIGQQLYSNRKKVLGSLASSQ